MSNELTVEQAVIEAQKVLLDDGDNPFELKRDRKDRLLNYMEGLSHVLPNINFYELSKKDFGKQNVKQLIGEMWIPVKAIQDAYERGDLRNTFAELTGQRSSIDIEELIIDGNSQSNDPYLALLDGMIANAEKKDDFSSLEGYNFLVSSYNFITYFKDDTNSIISSPKMRDDCMLAIDSLDSIDLGFNVSAACPIMAKKEYVAIRLEYFVLFDMSKAKTYVREIVE